MLKIVLIVEIILFHLPVCFNSETVQQILIQCAITVQYVYVQKLLVEFNLISIGRVYSPLHNDSKIFYVRIAENVC